MIYHTTYNMTFALVAFAEGFEVYCCHPDDDDVRLWSTDEIEGAEGHLFLIRDRSAPPILSPENSEWVYIAEIDRHLELRATDDGRLVVCLWSHDYLYDQIGSQITPEYEVAR